ncbi:hypothetical protein BH09PSE4_BH09PSE4_17160 [soil metagenome]
MPDPSSEPAARLDGYDRDEWREVARRLRPDWSDAEFDRAWVEFVAMKRRRAMH